MSADPAITCTPHPPPTADGSPRSFDPAWRTETVSALAKGIEAEGAFDRLPILADALEEAGCDDEMMLRHCRECERHEAECWALNETLDHVHDGNRDLVDSRPVPDHVLPRYALHPLGGEKRYMIFSVLMGVVLLIWMLVFMMTRNPAPHTPTRFEPKPPPLPADTRTEQEKATSQAILNSLMATKRVKIQGFGKEQIDQLEKQKTKPTSIPSLPEKHR